MAKCRSLPPNNERSALERMIDGLEAEIAVRKARTVYANSEPAQVDRTGFADAAGLLLPLERREDPLHLRYGRIV